MTDVILPPVTSGYNISRINNNFLLLANKLNKETMHTVGGGNVLDQDLDMNGNNLLNLKSLEVDTLYLNGRPVTTSEFILGDHTVGTSALVDYSVTDNKIAPDISISKFKFNQGLPNSVDRNALSKIKDFAITPQDFGALANGVNDDVDAVDAAIAAVANRGGGMIHFPAGRYKFSRGLAAIPSNISLTGDGKGATVLDFSEATSEDWSGSNRGWNGGSCIMIKGQVDPTYTPVGIQQPAMFDYKLTTVSAHGLAINDVFLLRSSVDSLTPAAGEDQLGSPDGSSNRLGELLIVREIPNSTTITLIGDLSYTTYPSNTSTITKLKMVENVNIHNMTIVSSETVCGISVGFGRNINIESVEMLNSYYLGINIVGCMSVNINNNVIYFNPKRQYVIYNPGIEMGVRICGYNNNIMVRGNTVENPAQGLDVSWNASSPDGTSILDGPACGISFDNNNVRGCGSQAFSTHAGCDLISFTNNVVNSCGGGIYSRSRNCIISGNILNNGNDDDIPSSLDFGVNLSGDGFAVNQIVTNNIIRGYSKGAIFHGGSAGRTYRNINISSNHITKCGADVILIGLGVSTTGNDISGITIDKNTIVGIAASKTAIFISGRNNLVKITDNSIRGPFSVTAIQIGSGSTQSVGCQVVGNTFSNIGETTPTVTIAVNSCYARVENNILKGTGILTNGCPILDDNVMVVPVPAGNFYAMVTTDSGFNQSAYFQGRTRPPSQVNSILIGGSVTLTTGQLTGTTGTDGKITISTHTDGNLYIENRTGGTKLFVVSFLCGAGSAI